MKENGERVKEKHFREERDTFRLIMLLPMLYFVLFFSVIPQSSIRFL